MQKVLRINLNARNQALKNARRKTLKNLKNEWAEHDQTRIAQDKQLRGLAKTERRNRREDWVAGPLAPKRDTGTQRGFYGTIDSSLVRGPAFPASTWKGPKGNGWDPVGSEGREGEEPVDWEGFGNEGNIIAGDRVCIIRGKDSIKGRIGVVRDVSKERKEVTIEEINTADVEIPIGQVEREQKPFTTADLPIPIKDVRLVFRHTEHDETTGRVIRDRDVIVKLIRGGGPYLIRDHYSPLPRHTRYIAGEDVEIPWPDVEVPQYAPHPGDTRRLEVETKTYTPSIYTAPLPTPSILDELRPKFRIDRQWHEDEYVRMKIIEDARSRWYEARTIDPPEVEHARLLKEQREQRGKELKEQGLSERTQRIIALEQLVNGLTGTRKLFPEVQSGLRDATKEIGELNSLVESMRLQMASRATGKAASPVPAPPVAKEGEVDVATLEAQELEDLVSTVDDKEDIRELIQRQAKRRWEREQGQGR